MPYVLSHTERLKYWVEMELSTRTTNCLVMNGIDSVEELMRYDNTQLLRMPNFGRVSLREVREWLDIHFKSKFDMALANLTNEQLLAEVARRMRNHKLSSTVYAALGYEEKEEKDPYATNR